MKSAPSALLAMAAAFALSLAATTARADGELPSIITASDRARLDGYEATRKAAIEEARAGGSAQDIATLDAVAGAPPQALSGFDMTGNWRCRTIKAGGLSALVVYGWFKCKVTDDGSGWRLEKLSGSQRTTGRFYDDGGTRLVYLGSFSVNDDEPLPYASGPDSDQVGYAFRTGSNRMRIEFPAPRYESKLDILELTR